MRKNGAISPFRVLPPPPFSTVFFFQFEANLCDEASSGLVGLSLVLYAFRLFRSLDVFAERQQVRHVRVCRILRGCDATTIAVKTGYQPKKILEELFC